MRNTSSLPSALKLSSETCWQPGPQAHRKPGFLFRLRTMVGVLAPSSTTRSTLALDAESARREITFAPGQIWSGSFAVETRVLVRSGQIWLTQNNDAEDYLLRAGEEFVAAPHAHFVISALGKAADIEFDSANQRLVR